MTSTSTILFNTNAIEKHLGEALITADYSQIFVVVDEHTKECCYPIIIKSLPDNHQLISIPSGELNKTLGTCEVIWQALTENQADRHALLINLGGGVICDMGGFCARTYKRGIKFWNIPTTLLSQVDASVGGKLGIDFGAYKNHIGLFSEPDAIFVDTHFLRTLPAEEILSGYAEIVKHTLIHDKLMFENLSSQEFKSLDWADLVPHSIGIKNEIVQLDPLELGLRKILNFGHTIGHAIESYYLDKPAALKHGEAIAIGMIAETYLSAKLLSLPKNEADAIVNYLHRIFKHHIIDAKAKDFITTLALQDKKNKKGMVNAVLLEKIGKPKFDVVITASDIAEAIDYYNNLPI